MFRATRQQLPYATPYLVVTALSVAMFFPTWFRLAEEWLEWQQVLAHGLATFVIFVGLIIIHPPRPENQAPAGFFLAGGLALVGVALIWAVLELVRIDTLAYLMLPAAVATTAWALLGFRAMLGFLPYVILLGLSLPIWADLVPLLVDLASAVVGNFVRLFGMTALIEGSSITLPYGRLIIADGCSGIRYFAISILLAVMVSILNDFRWKGLLMAIITGAAIGLLVNWVRISALVIIADVTRMESSLMQDHEMFGWIVYAAFIIPVLWLAPVKRRGTDEQAPKPIKFRGLIFVGIALLIGVATVTLSESATGEQSPWQLSELQTGKTGVHPDRLPITLPIPDHLRHQAWQTDAGVFISLAQSQRESADDKLVPYLRRSVDTDHWYQEASHNQGRVLVYRNISSRQQIAISQRYQVGDYRADSYRKAKLLQIPATLSGQTRFALITLQARCGGRSCEDAVRNLEAVSASLGLEPSDSVPPG
jgi:exosortase